MTLLERIQKEVRLLPLEKQGEALDFILFLLQHDKPKLEKKNSLRKHPAYGSCCGRNVDALQSPNKLRSECG